MNIFPRHEHAACGVGFTASRQGHYSHLNLQRALQALAKVEHRGACAADGKSSDGAGIMTDIPFELLGYERGKIAVATIFMPPDAQRQKLALAVFEETFAFYGLKIMDYRPVPIEPDILGPIARECMPAITQAIIRRPDHCRTDASFDGLLYTAKQHVRTREREHGIVKEFFFASLSANTVVYKALTTAVDLPLFYPDLRNPEFKTRFALYHRRFSTNTRTAWDKVQPFRLIGHNGEINTIAGNRSWALSREKSLGLRSDELLTLKGISDSGTLNELAEALKYRSSIPNLEDILAIMIPPAHDNNRYYNFWGRAMEPWDGPAIVVYCDGQSIGARLDRNGFRPARWVLTHDSVYLSSEAGSFGIDESTVEAKGSLHAGTGMTFFMDKDEVFFRDPGDSIENREAAFDPRLIPLKVYPQYPGPTSLHQKQLFQISQDELDKLLIPMALEGKEPIGSMGDTARLAIFSDLPRSFFDYFYQNFAQVTNPPLDYLRERMVTDLRVFLGAKPNIFEPKELIPLEPALLLKSPVLSLSEMQQLENRKHLKRHKNLIVPQIFDILFEREQGVKGFEEALKTLQQEVLAAVDRGVSIIILSDRKADPDYLPIPSLLALRKVVNTLNASGRRLRASIVMHSGEVRTPHQVAALIGFGAAAVCPYLALEIAAYEYHPKLKKVFTAQKEQNLIQALENGLLKIMAKSGISVVRSYQSAKRFTSLGLGPKLTNTFFPGQSSPIGGIEIEELVADILRNADRRPKGRALMHTYLFREHNKETQGERHAMTSRRSRQLHAALASQADERTELYRGYLAMGSENEPVHIRHLLDFKAAAVPLPLDQVQSSAEILKKFGSGAMSFGAISAESQRDIFEAMREIGGRSNSGEGGENPYYYSDGISASTKQVASGRFGVTAEYLISGREIQIKIAQGAKPGEGGQLMGIKVTDDIAQARHATPGTTLISPPPLHDIYSIEDLKELIYELKQLKPSVKVSVKLVAGFNVGTIAVGVTKAGADIIYVCGYDGGTGAAVLGSMKHAGLPWELGLLEAHRALCENELRHQVELRTDGGLHSGRDLVMASLMGAQGFEFGKLLLIAEGCIMARVCEKNTCPRGIATHDPKFKQNYRGTKEDVMAALTLLAEEAREYLSLLGLDSFEAALGRTDLLQVNARHQELITRRRLDLSWFLQAPALLSHPTAARPADAFEDEINVLNTQILKDTKEALKQNQSRDLYYQIQTGDRAIPATLAGQLALRQQRQRHGTGQPYSGKIKLIFRGSAGQGFGVFLTPGLELHLFGEANDSVCKSMSGGKVVIRPHPGASFEAGEQSIIGNCALYGATGGNLYVNGLAGDRFGVRNSGAIAVVEGTGLHCCEYMTNGLVVVLGLVSQNVGAGMTGGVLFLYGDQAANVNAEYLSEVPLSRANSSELKALLSDYLRETGSLKARRILEHWNEELSKFHCFLPKAQAESLNAQGDLGASLGADESESRAQELSEMENSPN